jgi:hypothetical protein
VSLIVELAKRLDLDPATARERLEEGAATDVARSYRRSWREAYVAAAADHRIRSHAVNVSGTAVESLPFSEFDEFCHRVWAKLGHSQPLHVSKVDSLPSAARAVLAETDASARWAYPPTDSLGMPRAGSLAGTEGIVGYVDVQATGQVRMVALHEIAHLTRDEAKAPCGHDLAWAEIYCALQDRFLDQATALTWAFEWTWWLSKALEHLDRDPDWLMDGHEKGAPSGPLTLGRRDGQSQLPRTPGRSRI